MSDGRRAYPKFKRCISRKYSVDRAACSIFIFRGGTKASGVSVYVKGVDADTQSSSAAPRNIRVIGSLALFPRPVGISGLPVRAICRGVGYGNPKCGGGISRKYSGYRAASGGFSFRGPRGVRIFPARLPFNGSVRSVSLVVTYFPNSQEIRQQIPINIRNSGRLMLFLGAAFFRKTKLAPRLPVYCESVAPVWLAGLPTRYFPEMCGL